MLQPGQRDGQTKIVNDGEAIRAYSWSQNEQRWIKIGDVMGATGGSAATSGKQLYNGKEYDYVFSVDIQDGVPPLKLPYNNDQDPWHVAQKFLHDNELSQLFLDQVYSSNDTHYHFLNNKSFCIVIYFHLQVANFIIKNSQPAPVVKADAQYADPFTGGSRYIPQATDTVPQECAKPATINSSDTSLTPSYIPHIKYLKLEQANLPAILGIYIFTMFRFVVDASIERFFCFLFVEKLRELNSKQSDPLKVSDEQLECLVKLAGNQTSEQLRGDALNTLMVLLNWSDDVLFPVLDITRLVVLCKDINDVLCTDELLQIVKNHIRNDALPSNQMLVFRLLANMFAYEKGEKLCINYKDEILRSILDLQSLGSKNNQVQIVHGIKLKFNFAILINY